MIPISISLASALSFHAASRWTRREYLNLSAGFAGDDRGMGKLSAFLHHGAIRRTCALYFYEAVAQVQQRVRTRILPQALQVTIAKGKPFFVTAVAVSEARSLSIRFAYEVREGGALRVFHFIAFY